MTALAEGATVVTANNRAAAWLREQFDAVQIGAGYLTWSTPSILPWSTWVRTLWQALRAECGLAGPQILTPWQEQRVWASVVAERGEYAGLNVANAGELAASAWEVVHGWRGQWTQWGRYGAREEHSAFVKWAKEFERECAARDWIDAARLPALIIEALGRGAGKATTPTVFYGFTEFSPQQRALVDALNAAGVRVTECGTLDPARVNANDLPRRLHCADPADEWRQCAQWCREWLARDPQTRIGVVIPDLAMQRPHVERIFREVLAPNSLFSEVAADLPFNLSHADPLACQPLVDVALALLGWAQAPLGLTAIAALARSPYLAGYRDEWPRRAQLVRDLTQEPQDLWRPLDLAQFTRSRTPVWSASLSALASTVADWRTRRPAKAWRRVWEESLEVAGWLADTTLDSYEYQARGAWSELLDAWMRAEAITGRMSGADAFASLQRLTTETAFQPEQGSAPVQILGTLEASGLYFDGLWICGLTAERWPPAPQPSPFLPPVWQRMVQAPHASAERELRYHRELTAGFAAAASRVVFSWPEAIDGIPAAPSPLLAEFAPIPAAVALMDSAPSLALQMIQTDLLATLHDMRGPILEPSSPATGRVALVEAQANCPFQAYAAFRLLAEPWPQRSEGLTPAERGTLVHHMLAEFWHGIPDQDALHALEGEEWTARCETAVHAALDLLPAPRWKLLGETFRSLERERLLKLLREWLALEYDRPPFAVVDTESKQTLTIAAMELRLKIDRIDRVGGNQLVVIDYKTGKAAVADLLREERLIAPQLPLYAEALEPSLVVALAYASVRRGETRVSGVAATGEIWGLLKTVEPDWTSVRARWKSQLHALVEAYRQGIAAVDPWQYPATCNRCGRHALCRINELIAFTDGNRQAQDPDADGAAL